MRTAFDSYENSLFLEHRRNFVLAKGSIWICGFLRCKILHDHINLRALQFRGYPPLIVLMLADDSEPCVYVAMLLFSLFKCAITF